MGMRVFCECGDQMTQGVQKDGPDGMVLEPYRCEECEREITIQWE